jgi:hypothetical protein
MKILFFIYFCLLLLLLIFQRYSSFNARSDFNYRQPFLCGTKFANRNEKERRYSLISRGFDNYQPFRTSFSRFVTATSYTDSISLSVPSLTTTSSNGETSMSSLKKDLKSVKEEYRELCRKERDIMALKGSLSATHKKELLEIRALKSPVRTRMNQLSEKLELLVAPNDRKGPVGLSFSDKERNVRSDIIPLVGKKEPDVIISWRQGDTASFKRIIGEREQPSRVPKRTEAIVSRSDVGSRRNVRVPSRLSSSLQPLRQDSNDVSAGSFPRPVGRYKLEVDFKFLQGKTLQTILHTVITKVGFETLYKLTSLGAFKNNPSLNSALKLLRSPSAERARKKIEILYCKIMMKEKL